MKRSLQTLVGVMLMLFSTSLMAQSTVTFTVYDLGQQHEEIYIKGLFNDWTNVLMTEIEPGVWRSTFAGIPEGDYEWGAVNENDSWLISGSNRTFSVDEVGVVTGQIAYYIAAPGSIDITFNIDMNGAIDAGEFIVGADVLEIVGSINGWPGTTVPEAWQPTDADEDGIYTLTSPAVFNEGEQIQFKFRLNGNWDTNEFPGPVPNREYTVRAENNIYDAVYGTYMFDPNYLEDFNSVEPIDPDDPEPVVYGPPASWVVLDEDGDGYSWEFRMTEEEDGYPISHSAIFDVDLDDFVPLAPNNWLITPPINLLGYETAEQVVVKFQVASSASTPAYTEEKYKVVLAEANTIDPLDFTNELWVETLTEEAGSYNYLEREIDITEFAGGQIRLAFVHFDCTDMDRLSIENVAVEATFAEPVTYTVQFNVEDGEANAITDASIMLHDYLYAPGDYDIEGMVEKVYNFYVLKYGFEWFEGTVDVSDATAVEGIVTQDVVLASLPEYTVTFTVTDGENPIEGATVTVNQEDVVTDASGIATFQLVDGTYAYGVTKEGYEPGSGEIVVDGAVVNEAVELVLISSVGSEAMNSLAIFPNPAAEFFNIASARKIATVRVFNVTGQEVLTISDINEEKYTVNTSMLNSGIYIVSVTDNNGFTSSKRIVKK